MVQILNFSIVKDPAMFGSDSHAGLKASIRENAKIFGVEDKWDLLQDYPEVET